MSSSEKINIDLNNTIKMIKDIDKKIEENNKKLLEGKTLEEQEKLRKKWEKERIDRNKKYEEMLERHKKELKKLHHNQSQLTPIEDLVKGLDDMMKESNEKYKQALKETMEELLNSAKTEEEKNKMVKQYKQLLQSQGITFEQLNNYDEKNN